MLQRTCGEVGDLVGGGTRGLVESGAEPTPEDATDEVERIGGKRQRPPSTRAAQHATLAQVEGHELVARATGRARLEQWVEALEREQLPEEGRHDEGRVTSRQGANRRTAGPAP